MSQLADAEAEIVEDPTMDAGQESPPPTNPAMLMTGYMAVRLTVNGSSRTVWQDIRSGFVVGFVDRYGRPVLPEGAFEAWVISGLLLASPGTKGQEA
jgi:hypothetical protein